jgi:16S rRNA (uracil1498-N3)-methyltransferase
MHRLFCTAGDISGNRISITDYGQVHHCKGVLRLRENDEVIACDEKGNEYASVVEHITAQCVVLKIKNSITYIAAKKAKITVACALPKKSKFDDIIDKLTQLGVDRIIPMQTQRVIVKFHKDTEKSRLERWKKIALNASAQSQRNIVPVIEPVKKIEDVLAEAAEFDLKLIPALIDARSSLKQVLINRPVENILVLIGPEGDFSPEEVAMATRAGCIPVTLGQLVLRVETASVAVVSMLNYALQ